MEEAKSSFKKSKADLAAIPEELWLEIFQFTCGISRSVIEDTPKLLSFPVPSHQKTLHKRKASLLRLMRVCKLWHRIALPFLYEHIVISSDLRMVSFGHESIEMEIFTSLLLLLPNLRILIIESNYLPPSLYQTQALTNTTIQTATFPMFESFGSHRRFLGNATNVAVTLPNLRQVHFTEPQHDFHDFVNNGLNAQIGIFRSVTSVLISPNFKNTYTYLFRIIAAFFPSVQYIGIQCDFADLNRPFDPAHGNTPLYVPPTVHTLGFWFCKPQAKNATYRALCHTLSQIHGDALKVIRFGERTVVDLRGRPFASALVNETLQAKGWRMEGGDMYV
ncbi:hypothetical protein BT96DRAFT_997176 [Gymnopus androsaceus JB14]|uniref:F-box domain-containing protein n=1 Tax=Gymnopus androsaceus JB14 TaxID=1447944 RepID=A0A6A4HDY0_9AGAR|nr:hypothetical protein BT96DRAFT_997176 [Gymnopus androsaceus JB14]